MSSSPKATDSTVVEIGGVFRQRFGLPWTGRESSESRLKEERYERRVHRNRPQRSFGASEAGG